MSSKLSLSSRIAVILCALAMIGVLYFPIWRIELSAPQYPEGLVLQIFANRIGGNIDVVNGLNHYIGMRTLHTRDFVEFLAIPYIIGGFAALGLVVILVNRRGAFYTWTALFLLIAFASMVDFYRWEYNYGHNLDPEAPIQVPGMAYQPPLLGYKQLLNFGAYSVPDIGGWLFILVGLALAGFAVLEWRRHRRPARLLTPVAMIALLTLTLGLQSCQSGPQTIRYGQDNCDFCRMTFSDRHFGGEICTKKGKVFKYDDLHCLLKSLKANIPAREQVATVWLVDYSGGEMVPAGQSILVQDPGFQTPMNGNIAAFANREAANVYLRQSTSKSRTWKELYQ